MRADLMGKKHLSTALMFSSSYRMYNNDYSKRRDLWEDGDTLESGMSSHKIMQMRHR